MTKQSEAKLAQLQAELKSTKEAHEKRLQQDKEAREREVGTLKQKLEDATKRMQELQQELAVSKKQLADANGEKVSLEKQIQALRASLSDKPDQSRIVELQQEIEELKRKLEERGRQKSKSSSSEKKKKKKKKDKKDKKKDHEEEGRIQDLESELAELKSKHATDLRILKEQFEDRIMILEAENDNIKNIVERPLFENKADGFVKATSEVMEKRRLEESTKLYRTKHEVILAEYEKITKHIADKEAELRAIVLRNQEIIEKWTHRQLSTMEDIVVVQLE